MYTIGIDLGGTNIAAGIVDENYNIVKKILYRYSQAGLVSHLIE